MKIIFADLEKQVNEVFEGSRLSIREKPRFSSDSRHPEVDADSLPTCSSQS